MWIPTEIVLRNKTHHRLLQPHSIMFCAYQFLSLASLGPTHRQNQEMHNKFSPGSLNSRVASSCSTFILLMSNIINPTIGKAFHYFFCLICRSVIISCSLQEKKPIIEYFKNSICPSNFKFHFFNIFSNPIEGITTFSYFPVMLSIEIMGWFLSIDNKMSFFIWLMFGIRILINIPSYFFENSDPTLLQWKR